MINGTNVSYEAIMDRVFDLGIQPQFIDEVMAREAMFNALTLMGAPEAYEPKTSILTITQYRAELPCDILDITHGGVRTYPTGIPLTVQTSVYHLEAPHGVTEQTVDPLELDPDTRTLVTGSSGLLIDEMHYLIRGGFIYVGFSDGKIEMAYSAFPTDSRGMPAIPNNTRVIEGVVFYVAKQFAARMYMRDELSRDKFEYINSECAWYMASGANALRIPTIDRMENIKNLMNTPVPQYNAHRAYFRTLGRQPRIITHTR